MSHKPGRRPSEGWSRKFAEQWDKLTQASKIVNTPKEVGEELDKLAKETNGKKNGTAPTRKPRSSPVKTKTPSKTG